MRKVLLMCAVLLVALSSSPVRGAAKEDKNAVGAQGRVKTEKANAEKNVQAAEERVKQEKAKAEKETKVAEEEAEAVKEQAKKETKAAEKQAEAKKAEGQADVKKAEAEKKAAEAEVATQEAAAGKGKAKGKDKGQQAEALGKQLVHEQQKSSERQIRLERMLEVAKEKGDTKAVERIEGLMAKEQERYNRKLETMMTREERVDGGAVPAQE